MARQHNLPIASVWMQFQVGVPLSLAERNGTKAKHSPPNPSHPISMTRECAISLPELSVLLFTNL